MKPKVDTAVTVILVLCALVTTGIIVRREFAPSPAAPAQAEQEPVLIKDWRSHLDKGVRLGSLDAPVQLIEFADFECPFCASFHKTLKEIRDRYPGKVALAFVHYPIPGHRFAEPAARVAECADEQGRFEAMHDRLFEEQDQLGLKAWRDFATEVSVADLPAFESCAQKNVPIPRVVEGKKLGEQLDIQVTPTLIVNGWKLGRPPTAEDLDRMVKAVLSGKSPLP